MATTFTPNYNLTKPSVGGDSNVWGNMLNADLDTIDTQMKTNAVAVANLDSSLKAVAKSGAYSDLTGKPSLGTAAAKNTGDFATAAQGAKADAAMPKTGGTFTGAVTLQSSQDISLVLAAGTGHARIFLANNNRSVQLTHISTGSMGFYDGTNSRWILKISSSDNASFRGTVTATDHINSSDKRLKKNIRALPLRAAFVDGLRLVSFDWKATDTADVGLIAQEVRKFAPEFVHEGDDGMLGVAYDKLAIAACAELGWRIGALSKQTADLERRIAALEAR